MPLSDSTRLSSSINWRTYQLEDSERYAGVAEEVLDAVAHGLFQGVTSILTLMEVNVRPLQLGRNDVADDYERIITSFPNLRVVGIDSPTARRAANLRAAYRLKPADALQIAACIENGATAFVTNDKALRRVERLIVVLLDGFVDRA